jgi:hypothetical protein
VRHQACIVDEHIDAAVFRNGAIDQCLHLLRIRDVRLDCRLFRKLKFGGKSLEAIDSTSAKYELRAVCREAPNSGLAKPAARAGNDDYLSCDVLLHAVLPCASWRVW